MASVCVFLKNWEKALWTRCETLISIRKTKSVKITLLQYKKKNSIISLSIHVFIKLHILTTHNRPQSQTRWCPSVCCAMPMDGNFEKQNFNYYGHKTLWNFHPSTSCTCKRYLSLLLENYLCFSSLICNFHRNPLACIKGRPLTMDFFYYWLRLSKDIWPYLCSITKIHLCGIHYVHMT